MDNLKNGWTSPKIMPLTAAGASEGGILLGLSETQQFKTVGGGFVKGSVRSAGAS